MKNGNTLLIAAAALALGGAGYALGSISNQEPQDAASAAPKPGAEHEILRKDAGNWNANVKIWMDPNAPPMEMPATESNHWTCNDLWMVTEFNTPDGSFSGRGIGGWDSEKKRYVSAWVDSSSMHLTTMVGTYDKNTKIITFTGEAPDPATGKMTKIRATTEYPDANKRRYTHYTTPAGGVETKSLEITYTRAQ